MAIDELTAFVEIPKTPSEVPAKPNWEKIEKKIGLKLPSDYKNFVITFGSGLLGSFVYVFNPFSKNEGIELTAGITSLCKTLKQLKAHEGEREVPFPIYPDTPGLLPWGGDENGNGYYWLTDGKPDQWPTIVCAGRDSRWQKFDMSMTTFLAKSLQGEIKCKIWPSDVTTSKRRRSSFESW